MNRFTNIDDAWLWTLQRIYKEGGALESRVDRCAELIGHSFTLTDVDRAWLTVRRRALDPCYAAAEVLWYLSGSSEIDMITAYAPQYCRFAEGNIAHGAYGHRWTHDASFALACQKYCTPSTDNERKLYGDKLNDKAVSTQIAAVITLLQEKPNTRQAVVTMWNAGDLLHAITGAHGDLPCTLGLQFLVRGARLNCVAYMRSNDVWLGLPYDVFAFTTVQRLIADALKIPCGTYTHCVGSMHLYERNRAAAEEACATAHEDAACDDSIGWPECEPGKLISQCISRALKIEGIVRCSSCPDLIDLELDGDARLNVVCRDLVELCISKHTKRRPDVTPGVLLKAWDLKYGAVSSEQ